MAKDTKEKIMESALDMFSQKGYDGTNMRELTGSLGLSKSSVYRHFESKEQIRDELVDVMEEYYSERFGSEDNAPKIPDSAEELVDMTLGMVRFTVNDPKVVKTRKFLTIEQYRGSRSAALATSHFLTGLTDLFTPVFGGMMDKGIIKKDDPRTVAFAFTAPVTALVHMCDREPEKIPQAMEQTEAFLRHFIKVYGTGR